MCTDRVKHPMSRLGSSTCAQTKSFNTLQVPVEMDIGQEFDLDDLMKFRALSQIAKYCWVDEPSERPTFQEISIMLSHLLGQESQSYAYELAALSLNEIDIQRRQSWKDITRGGSRAHSITGRGLIDHSLAVVEEDENN